MSDLGVVEGGTLLAENGMIRAIGPWTEVESQIPADAEVVDADGRLLMPGFVDAHTHLVFVGNRADEFEMRARGATYEQIAASGGGILKTVRKTHDASFAELLQAGRRHLSWMVEGGTTTVEAKSGYGLTLEDELKILRVYRQLNLEGGAEIVPTLLAPHAVPPEFGERAKEYIVEVAIPAMQKAKEGGLAEFADAFVEKGYFDEESLRPYFEEAHRLGLPLRLHVDQLREGDGAQTAARWGAKTADHLEQTGEKGFRAMAEAGVMPILLPASVFALGKSKQPDARAMIDAGLPVVLATDFNPGSSPCPSMLFTLNLSCAQMKMMPAEAISAATINAAHSLNRGHDRGSLEAGKRADLVLADAEDFRELPYWVGRTMVRRVWIRGNAVFDAS